MNTTRPVRDGSLAPAHLPAALPVTVWMPAPSDEARGVRGIDLFVHSDAMQLAELATRVDRGELTIGIAERSGA